MNKSRMLVLIALCCGVLFALPCSSADKGSWQPVGPEAIWKDAKKNIKSVFQECRSKKASDFGQCFVSFMQEHGASPQAVAFAKLTDNTGYLRAFRKVGPVGIAYVAYPFRANTNYGYLLVNGDPPMVDVDDLKLLKGALSKDPAYAKLLLRYPNAAIWPEDRFSTELPILERLENSGQRFIVAYHLTDLCRACKGLGKVRLAFDFDASGKFLGVKMVSLEDRRMALYK
jgi:hypothetical protein